MDREQLPCREEGEEEEEEEEDLLDCIEVRTM